MQTSTEVADGARHLILSYIGRPNWPARVRGTGVREQSRLSKSEQFLPVPWAYDHSRCDVKPSENNRDGAGWQPSQNVAFLIIASAMILGGVLALLL